jgi:hypothetical protein
LICMEQNCAKQVEGAFLRPLPYNHWAGIDDRWHYWKIRQTFCCKI